MPSRIGLLAGLLNGLIGIGGGIVIVPGLVLHAGATPQVAVGTSLAAVVALFGVAFAVHVAVAGFTFGLAGTAVVVASGIGGAQVGGAILARLTARWMLGLFALFLLLMSTRLVAQGVGLAATTVEWAGAPPAWAYPVLGVVSGVLSGTSGVGGGALVVLGFAVLFAMPVQEGLPLALAVNVTNALAGCVRHARARRVPWGAVARMVPASILGIGAGAFLAHWLPADVLRVVFGAFFLAMAVRLGRQAAKTR